MDRMIYRENRCNDNAKLLFNHINTWCCNHYHRMVKASFIIIEINGTGIIMYEWLKGKFWGVTIL